MTKTKEEILQNCTFKSISTKRSAEIVIDDILKAMQEYSDQENKRLTAIVSKYDKIFDCQNNFPPITCSISEIEKWQYKLSKLKSELEKLKAEL